MSLPSPLAPSSLEPPTVRTLRLRDIILRERETTRSLLNAGAQAIEIVECAPRPIFRLNCCIGDALLELHLRPAVPDRCPGNSAATASFRQGVQSSLLPPRLVYIE